MCENLTHTKDSNCIECSLCNLLMHSEESNPCIKYQTDKDLDYLSKDNNSIATLE